MPDAPTSVLAAAPTPGCAVQAFVDYRVQDDGSREFVCMRHEVSVDGEWIPVADLIEAWRAR